MPKVILANTVGPAKPPGRLPDGCVSPALLPSWERGSWLEEDGSLGESDKLEKAYRSSSLGPSSSSDSTTACTPAKHHSQHFFTTPVLAHTHNAAPCVLLAPLHSAVTQLAGTSSCEG